MAPGAVMNPMQAWMIVDGLTEAAGAAARELRVWTDLGSEHGPPGRAPRMRLALPNALVRFQPGSYLAVFSRKCSNALSILVRP